MLQEAYAVAAKLPAAERYNLADQLRRAATSAVLNVAEGYGRYHYPDALRFYYIARGSLDEVLAAFLTCATVEYTLQADLDDRQRPLVHSALRTLNGYIRYVRKQRQGRDLYGDRPVREDSPVYYPSILPPNESTEE